MKSTASLDAPLHGVSQKAKELLKRRSIKTLGDVYEGFTPNNLLNQLPSLTRSDVFGLARALRAEFGKREMGKKGWSDHAIRQAFKKLEIEVNQDIWNRLRNSVNGAHYKKPRRRRGL